VGGPHYTELVEKSNAVALAWREFVVASFGGLDSGREPRPTSSAAVRLRPPGREEVMLQHRLPVTFLPPAQGIRSRNIIVTGPHPGHSLYRRDSPALRDQRPGGDLLPNPAPAGGSRVRNLAGHSNATH